MWNEFKKFVARGNVLDLAVAVIIGGAFGAIVTSLVNDVVMPPIGLILGKVDFRELFFPSRRKILCDPGRSQSRRGPGDRLRDIPQHDHQFPDRRVRHLF